MKISVFIVDDHHMVIEGIRSLLKDEPAVELTGHAMNAESCLQFLLHNQPDVILMDINLPGMNGIQLCAEVRLKYPSTFVLGLSTFNQQSYIEKMMEAGASGYILKNATGQEILEALRVVMKGQVYLSHEAASSLHSKTGHLLPALTRREKEILILIAEGLTNVEIAERLFVSSSTIDTHRKNLLLKMDARNTAALVRIAMENGMLRGE